MSEKIYACFGGFSDQYWTKLSAPDIKGYCDGLTVCEMDVETGEMKVVSQSHGVDSPSLWWFLRTRSIFMRGMRGMITRAEEWAAG